MKAKCLNPNVAWFCGTIRSKADGALSPRMVFSQTEAIKYYQDIYGSMLGLKFMKQNETTVPCGKCLACQIRKRKEWTTRLSLESNHYQDCCFITLTYDDDNIPMTDDRPLKSRGDINDSSLKTVDRGLNCGLSHRTLLPYDVQCFIKRLRRHLEYQPKHSKIKRDFVDTPIRYYAVGEYGSKFGRPHYHLMIFGWCPSDMEFFKVMNGHAVSRSSQIEKLWKYGFSTVEPVAGGIAKYCSRYVTKKFARISSDDPFAASVCPEFYLQSVREGGIGAKWFDDNYEQMFERGYAIIKTGKIYFKQSIPSYFYNRLRKKNLCLWLQLRDERITFAKQNKLVDYDELYRSVQVYELNEVRLSQQELF